MIREIEDAVALEVQACDIFLGGGRVKGECGIPGTKQLAGEVLLAFAAATERHCFSHVARLWSHLRQRRGEGRHPVLRLRDLGPSQ